MASVAVLTGGPSHEHDVSLATARTVADGLARGGHDARIVYLSRSGVWHLGERGAAVDDVAAAAAADDPLGPSAPLHPSAGAVLDALAADGDVAFLALHGTFGEDGSVQRVLEARDIPYTGSGPIASSMAMDKELMKVAASKLGVACARHDVVEPDAEIDKRRLVAITGLPCVVKPVCGGSSVGVFFVDDKKYLRSAVTKAREADARGRAMVEEYVPGTDVTCCVVRLDGVVTALPVVAIETDGDVVDTHAKYTSPDTRFTCPAPLRDDDAAHIADVSVALYEHLGLRGVAHVDFIVRDDDRPVFLEVNTLPGYTPTSHVPRAARAHGLALEQLLDAVLADARRPSARRRGGGAGLEGSAGA